MTYQFYVRPGLTGQQAYKRRVKIPAVRFYARQDPPRLPKQLRLEDVPVLQVDSRMRPERGDTPQPGAVSLPQA